MKIEKPAVCGSMESSDIMISLFPAQGLSIDLESSVDIYYHDSIIKVIEACLKENDVSDVKVKAVDHGALDCTIKARMNTAIKRSKC